MVELSHGLFRQSLHANIELEVEFAKLVNNGVEKQAKLAKILLLSSAKLRGQIKKIIDFS